MVTICVFKRKMVCLRPYWYERKIFMNIDVHIRLFMMLWWLWVVGLRGRWSPGDKAAKAGPGQSVGLLLCILECSLVYMLAFLVHLCTWTCLHTCVVFTFPYLYTWGTQHHQWVLRLWKYTSANSLDNNSQSERIPSEEGSRVQIGQNAMALEGGEGSLVLELSILKILNSSFGRVSS